MGNRISAFRMALLTPIPMMGALLGGLLDERHHLGFTTWRSACRAAGLRFSSLTEFTLQLLPSAVIGLLSGGILVLFVGVLLRERFARASLAAHAGCAVSLPVALMLCALLPPMLMLATDAVLALLAAWALSPRGQVSRC